MFTSQQLEIRSTELGLEPYIPEAQTAFTAARERDEILLSELHRKNNDLGGHESAATGLRLANAELARLSQEHYSASQLDAIESLLKTKGTLDIPLVTGRSVIIGGNTYPISFVGATELSADGTNHGEMSSMFYMRDHIQIARALMELYLQDPSRYANEGKLARELTTSALHCISTPKQLERFQTVIRKGRDASQEEWPHISLWFNDLQGEEDNGWRNQQDTFQMLADHVFDAIDRDFLRTDDLLEEHKQFLGSCVPLLASVGYPLYPSSGSWEEFAANRTSVMCVETAMLNKVNMLRNSKCQFLRDYYEHFKPANGQPDFGAQVESMLDAGLKEIGRRLPYESPDYEPDSITYREADIAMAYALMYGLPQLLAEASIPIGTNGISMSVEAIEDLILAEIEMLTDPETNGHVRYRQDSYQRVNFHTHEVQLIVRAIKDRVKRDALRSGSAINLEDKQALRGKLTPQGKEAAWTHPLGQLSSWAAKRKIEARARGDQKAAARYDRLSQMYFNRALSTITGKDHWNAALNDQGIYEVQHVKPYRLPECMIAYETSEGETFIVPSPHTPLNWSSAMTRLAVGLLYIGSKEQS
jgi:hypothetical protein